MMSWNVVFKVWYYGIGENQTTGIYFDSFF